MPKNEYICDCNMVHKEMVQDTLSKMPENETFLHSYLTNFQIEYIIMRL